MFAPKSHRRPSARPTAVVESMDSRRYCDGDNSFATATDLGTVSTYVAKNNGHLTKNSDTKDFYKFTCPGSAAFTVKLGGLSGNADLYLYDKNKNPIASSKNGGTSSDVITKALSVGTYYVEARLKGDSTDYNLKLTSDNIGNSLNKATDLGTVNQGVQYKGYVGTLDASDYYAFHTAPDGTVTVQLDGLSDDANVELLKADGTKIALADNGGTTEEQIAVTLPAGKYFAKVVPANGSVNAKYTLTVSGPAASDGNDSIQTATGVANNTTVAGSVGKSDVWDYYKFTVSDSHWVTLSLKTQDNPVTLAFFNTDGSMITSDNATKNDAAGFTMFLGDAGTYYVAPVNATQSVAHYQLDIKTFTIL